MQNAPRLPYPDDPLWHRIATCAIGGIAAATSFVTRLARENLWTQRRADAVIGEYRRFCYLACTAGHDVTPSDAVDQAWHLHLTYSCHYWNHFCPEILGKRLHHWPGAGSDADTRRFYRQYEETLAFYEATFGQPAPPSIWPSPSDRFHNAGAAVRIDGSRFLLVRKSSLPGRLLRRLAKSGLD